MSLTGNQFKQTKYRIIINLPSSYSSESSYSSRINGLSALVMGSSVWVKGTAGVGAGAGCLPSGPGEK